LKKTGITHILNVATGVRNRFSDDFSYLAITVDDSPTENIKSFFAEALDFMYKAVENGGKV
jgi:hypothetical protein